MTKICKLRSQDIRVMRSAGKSTEEISRHLKSLGVHATLSTIRRHYKERLQRKRKPRKVTEEILTYTQQSDKLSSRSVKKQLWSDRGVKISDRSIRRIRQNLGWKYGKNQHRSVMRENSSNENMQSPQTRSKTRTALILKKKPAFVIDRRRPAAVTVSKKRISEFTKRLQNLEARMVLLEARLSENTHPPTAEKSTSTESPADVLPMRSSPQTAPEDHMLGDVNFGVPAEASTPLIVRTPTHNLHTSPNHSSVGSASVGGTNNPVLTTLVLHDENSQSKEDAAFSPSFQLRLPETQRKTRSLRHDHARQSRVQGVILQDVSLNQVTVEAEDELFLKSARPGGNPRADRFAVLLFKRLIPLILYQDWSGTVNFDGSRGKNALPNNVRQALSEAVDRRFQPTIRDWKIIRERLNELLRNRRTTFPLFEK